MAPFGVLMGMAGMIAVGSGEGYHTSAATYLERWTPHKVDKQPRTAVTILSAKVFFFFWGGASVVQVVRGRGAVGALRFMYPTGQYDSM